MPRWVEKLLDSQRRCRYAPLAGLGHECRLDTESLVAIVAARPVRKAQQLPEQSLGGELSTRGHERGTSRSLQSIHGAGLSMSTLGVVRILGEIAQQFKERGRLADEKPHSR
jgi:hypothetical protein